MTGPHDTAAAWERWTDADIRIYGVQKPEPIAAFLAKYAGARALELGPGAGVVAYALAEHGVPVVALDISANMCERIEQHRAGRPVTAVVGDMTVIDVDGTFDLVYSTTSTIFSLLTQQQQIDCFANMARVLAPGGTVALEAFAPLRQGAVVHRQNLALRAFDDDRVDLSATVHDPAAQRITFREVRMTDGQPLTVLPVDIRYAWPSELDLMARLAGLILIDRFGAWDRRPYDANCPRHVSVYGRA
jgi:cyclopropane fatty-acyl-phospholipid synthase-like methyltransferase